MSTTKEREIAELCSQHSCTEKIRKIHFDQFIHRNWHPHPSVEFERWWAKHADFTQGISIKVAWNCQRYRQEFLKAREVGAA